LRDVRYFSDAIAEYFHPLICDLRLYLYLDVPLWNVYNHHDLGMNSVLGDPMPKYVIEREIPGVGNLTADQLQAISQTSCGVLSKLGPQIQWVESYVTGDKIYCIYIAPNEEMVREHAKQGGFPANRVAEVKNVINPTTAEKRA
jgi:hypothetical protein